MPGQLDVWNHVTSFDLRRAAARLTRPSSPRPDTSERTRGAGLRSSRALRIGALATALVVLTGGSLAFAGARKTVTLDVDGRTTQITTFAGSVGGVLDDHELEIGQRDVVAPEPGTTLRDGDEVVVRYARQVTVLADGEESTVWTTALSADEALSTMSGRGEDVRLMASRSAASGRADLAVRLDLDGPVTVVADDEEHPVADGSVGLETVLADLDLTVGELDRVSVHRPEADGPLTVQIQRVVAAEKVTTSKIDFDKKTQRTDELFVGESEVATKGRNGVREVTHRVITVDGKEESRMLLSDEVTRKPRTHVVRVGTRERPVVAAPKPSSSSSSSSGGGGSSVGGDVWAALAQCESGGNPSIVSSNGLYYGLYQFSLSTWASVGGSGLPSQASPAEQTERAKALQARSGWGQWPHCSSKLGLR